MGMTSYLRKKLLDHFLNKATFTPPAVVYLSLHTGVPGDSGLHTNEVSTVSTGYARQAIVTGAVDTVTGAAVNTAVITIGSATADWGIITHLGVEDNSVPATSPDSGNMFIQNAATTAKLIVTGESYQLIVGQLSIRFE